LLYGSPVPENSPPVSSFFSFFPHLNIEVREEKMPVLDRLRGSCQRFSPVSQSRGLRYFPLFRPYLTFGFVTIEDSLSRSAHLPTPPMPTYLPGEG